MPVRFKFKPDPENEIYSKITFPKRQIRRVIKDLKSSHLVEVTEEPTVFARWLGLTLSDIPVEFIFSERNYIVLDPFGESSELTIFAKNRDENSLEVLGDLYEHLKSFS